MKRTCPDCRHEFELGLNTLPECPKCIANRMQHPDGIKPEHTPLGASTRSSFASYIADGVSPTGLFDYMSNGPHTHESGCVLFSAPKHNSFNAVSYLPLGDIPGSGIKAGSHFASEFAVLVDVQGNNSEGPHWNFEEEPHLQQRIANKEWIPAPKCAHCAEVYVYSPGDICLNCQSKGDL